MKRALLFAGLIGVAGSAAAEIPAEVTAAIAQAQTDGLGLVSAVLGVVVALTFASIMIKFVRRYGSRV